MKKNADFFVDVVKNESSRPAFRGVMTNLVGTSETHLVNLRIPPRGKDAAHQFSWRIPRAGSVSSYFSPCASIVLCKFSQSNVSARTAMKSRSLGSWIRYSLKFRYLEYRPARRGRREETLGSRKGARKIFGDANIGFSRGGISLGNGIKRVTGAAWRVSPRGTRGDGKKCGVRMDEVDSSGRRRREARRGVHVDVGRVTTAEELRDMSVERDQNN